MMQKADRKTELVKTKSPMDIIQGLCYNHAWLPRKVWGWKSMDQNWCIGNW